MSWNSESPEVQRESNSTFLLTQMVLKDISDISPKAMASFLIHMNMEHGSNQFLYQTVIGLYILGVWQPQHTTLSNLPHQAHGETSTPTLMAAMIQSDLWERAQMDSVVHYLMANRHLQLPEYFKGILLQGINP